MELCLNDKNYNIIELFNVVYAFSSNTYCIKNTVVLKFMSLAKWIQWNVNMYSEWEHDQRLYCMECVWEVSNHRVILYSIYSYRERSYCAILSFFCRNEATFIHNECRPTQNSFRSVMPIFRQELEEKLKISVYIPSFR